MLPDLATPLPDLEPDAPAGPNLEFDAAFGELERAATGTPERQSGDKIIPAEDPVWKEVAALAADLLDRTYDLRVLVHFAVARLHVAGLADFAAVLTQIAHLLETRWDHIHPQLDPEDDNDPAVRANALLPLASRTRVLRALRMLPIAGSRRAGLVTCQTIALATGEAEVQDGQDVRSESEIRAAFAETPPATIESIIQHAAAALTAVAAIKSAFDTNSGYGNHPDLDPLAKQLQDIGRYISRYFIPGAAADDNGDAPDETETFDAALADAGDETPAAPPSGVARRAGALNVLALSSVATRAEALHLLEVAARYFEQNEPSSPLPLMLNRARGLANKTFLEILQDLAPDGFGQAQMIVQSRE